MAGKKTDRIKIFLVIGLSMVLMTSGYLQIVRPRLRGTAQATASAPIRTPVPVIGPVQTPQIPPEAETKQKPKRSALSIEPIQSVRDIFAEPAVSEPVEKEKKEERPKPPPTQLKGTIVGGDHPIAIINGRFLRIGDRIDDYQVLQIEKDRVRLSSGKHDIVLEVFKNAHP